MIRAAMGLGCCFLLGVTAAGAGAPRSPADETPAEGSPAAVEHVIHISVDGLRGDLLAELIAGDGSGAYAGFERLAREGAATFNARTDATHTITLPNHTSMLTGRPVTAPPGEPELAHHGYTANGDPSPSATLHNRGNLKVPYIASVFDVAHDHGLKTALFASKSKFLLYERSYGRWHGAKDAVGTDNGADKIDVYLENSAGRPESAAPMHAAFLAAMAEQRFNYAFVHYRDTDTAGHDDGWGSRLYRDAAMRVSGYIGEVLDLVENDPALAGRTVVILSSDHGGSGKDHGKAHLSENYTVPFFVWGAGVTPGADLYELNPATRKDPEMERPDYDETLQPIRNADGANLALSLLKLPAIPGSMINARQDLRVAPLPPSPAPLPPSRPVSAAEATSEAG